MNIPAEWIATLGLAFAGALGLLWRFFTAMLERHEAAAKVREEERRAEIARLHDKQEKCDATTIDLTKRVVGIEKEREGFKSGMVYLAGRLSADIQAQMKGGASD